MRMPITANITWTETRYCQSVYGSRGKDKDERERVELKGCVDIHSFHMETKISSQSAASFRKWGKRTFWKLHCERQE